MIMMGEKFSVKIGDYESAVVTALEKQRKESIVQRIWEHDHTVWKPVPTEISNRLGWLHSPEAMIKAVDEINSFSGEVRSEGFTNALLLGMGGSSLAPEVLRNVFGVKPGYLELAVLDSTTPGAVSSFAKSINLKNTLFLVSTKSGSTVETLSFVKYFYNQVLDELGTEKVGRHFVAITDPNSGLQSLASNLNFRKIFLNDSDIGGRFSALSFFGLLPAGLIGVDLTKLLNRALVMSRNCRVDNEDKNPGAILGAIMGELAQLGRDKLTFIFSPAIASFGDWVEQLIAESTGKEGTGILPVVGEAILQPENYSNDRLFIHFKFNQDDIYDQEVKALSNHGHPVVEILLDDKFDLGGEFFRWEIATAIASYFLKINPFDQPNVESAKALARKMITTYQQKGKLPDSTPDLIIDNIGIYTNEKAISLQEALEKFLSQANYEQNDRGASYVAIQAFIQSTAATNAALHELRTTIQTRFKLATTVGYGPRFLHSTGQLHKGDSGNGLFIQITSDSPEEVVIPDKPGETASSMTFGVLVLAQALGDRQALLEADRKVIRFHLDLDTVKGINKLTQSIQ